MGAFGEETDQIDTLVLGCTHYPFVSTRLQLLVGESVKLLDAGAPVALQTRRLLLKRALLAPEMDKTTDAQVAEGAHTIYLTTGDPVLLEQALQNWLSANDRVTKITA